MLRVFVELVQSVVSNLRMTRRRNPVIGTPDMPASIYEAIATLAKKR